jgi:hypothetical protein
VARRSLRAQLYASTAYLIGGVGGGAIGGALGSSWGAACATFVGAIVWWWTFGVGIRERWAQLDAGEPVPAAPEEHTPPVEAAQLQDEMPEMRSI